MFPGSVVTLHGDGYHMGWRESGSCMVSIFPVARQGKKVLLSFRKKGPFVASTTGTGDPNVASGAPGCVGSGCSYANH